MHPNVNFEFDAGAFRVGCDVGDFNKTVDTRVEPASSEVPNPKIDVYYFDW